MAENPTTAAVAAPHSRQVSPTVQIGLAALLGLAVIGGTGFAHIEAVHNAAHDYRHSMGFPCH
jgi:cobalt transporter subunit CbtB